MSLKFGAFVPTIAKLEIVPLIYRLPKGRAYGMARGLTSIRQASLVKLTTDDGVEGIGEAFIASPQYAVELHPPPKTAMALSETLFVAHREDGPVDGR
jgi:L-alanine-DL-glutamate epimerase-like enolase superfamily enzyme